MAVGTISGPAAAALAALTEKQTAFLQSLPKAELHAHLNGSIPLSTLEELAQEYTPSPGGISTKDIQHAIETFKLGPKLEKIGDFFSLFPVIYTLTSTPEALRRATHAVLTSFLDGGSPQCHYLELRTGPRQTEAMSREEYMRVVLEEVERYDEDRAGLIMTLDRTKGPEIWQECLEIALKLKKEGRRLLGVDLAGDPLKADVSIFQSFFAEAREAGLGITLHIAEVCRSRPYLLYRPIFNCFALDAGQYG
jgi:adenosine deaminase